MKKLAVLIIITFTLSAQASLTPRVSFGVEDSNKYGFIAKARLVNNIGDHGAGTFFIQGGEKQFRLDLTLAYQFNAHNRLRFGLQHLAQRPELDFAAFPTKNWAGQPAIASTYEYLFNNQYLRGINVFGLYATARSTGLPDLPFSSNQQQFINKRNVAGSDLYGFGSGLSFSLWPQSMFEADAHYDDLRYKTLYEPSNNRRGFGVSGRLTQQLPAGFALAASADKRKIFDQYWLGISWSYITHRQNAFTVGFYGGQIDSDILPVKRDDRIGFDFSYRFGGDWANVSPAQASLLDWVQYTHATLPGVFVMRDQAIVAN